MRVFCRVFTFGFLLAYLLALTVLAIGTFGVLGSAQDPLVGVYLAPLGLPWNLLVDFAPEELWPLLATLAPTVNLAIIYGLCRTRSKRRRRSTSSLS
jgi:hypothetical protein